ncbi:MAG: TetR/AcrR family transcriptional regulator [Proteobacteria bacterium]|nr:TetR/AcrR family transcriptional regulator [Pseudomonadota bacterium]
MNETKTILLQIGLKLFSQATYEGVGVMDIANAASVTKPTLYHHFGSKLGFYQAVFSHYAVPFFDMIVQKAVYERDLVHNLNEIARASLEFFMANEEAYRMLEYAANTSHHAEHHAFVQAFWDDLTGTIRALFESAVPQHGNLAGKTEMSAWLFIFAIRAEICLVLKDRSRYSPDLPYKLVHQFMYGIFS